MEKASVTIKIKIFIKVSGRKVRYMEKGFTFGAMGRNTKDSSEMERKMEWENFTALVQILNKRCLK